MDIRTTQGFSAAMLGGMALGGLFAATLLCGAAPARADVGNDMLDLSDLQRVTDDSLGGLRGGFRVGNVDLSFGVTMSTSLNGQQILQTVFTPGEGTSASSAAGLGITQGANGFQVTSPDGRTTVNHDLGQSITTDIANSADNRVIQNTTTVDLFLNNVTQVQTQAQSARMMTNMMGELNRHISGN